MLVFMLVHSDCREHLSVHVGAMESIKRWCNGGHSIVTNVGTLENINYEGQL